MSTDVITTLRNAEITTLVDVLRSQQDLRFDHVASSSRLKSEGGAIRLTTDEPILTESGVSPGNVLLQPTDVFDGGLADRLAIPIKYLRKLRIAAETVTDAEGNVYLDLFDHNVNTWLGADPGQKHLVRGFLSPGSDTGVARAFLSNSYGAYDNLDFLMAALNGARQAGVAFDVVGADLSERRMRVRVACPEVSVLAPVLLRNYRSPFDNADPARVAQLEAHGWLKPDDRPVVFAGFTLGNSETGNGSWWLAPTITVRICMNGLTFKMDMVRGVHLGSKLAEGAVSWSNETQKANIELISAQAADVVRTFTTKEFVEAKISEIEEAAGVAISHPVDTLERVGRQLGFSQAEQDMILADFIAGGQATAGGLMQAVTSVAQRVEDPDRAAEFEDAALDVLVAAAKVAG